MWGSFAPILLLGLNLLSSFTSYLLLHAIFSKSFGLKEQTSIAQWFLCTRDVEIVLLLFLVQSYEVKFKVEWVTVHEELSGGIMCPRSLLWLLAAHIERPCDLSSECRAQQLVFLSQGHLTMWQLVSTRADDSSEINLRQGPRWK